MSESKKFSIVIAGRSYPLLVSEGEEEALKELESLVSASINKLQIQYQHLDKQDCLSMTLIQMALDAKNERNELDTSKEMQGKLEAIEKLLETV